MISARREGRAREGLASVGLQHMTPMPRRLQFSLWLLALTSLAMLVLASQFYGQSVDNVASGKIRDFVVAIVLAAALPYGWVLVHLLLGRRSVALLSGLACALLYVVGFGWLAVLLFLLSWGDITLWIPAMGLLVQVVALIASVMGWRALDIDARRAASRMLALGFPVILILLPLGFSTVLRGQIADLPAQREAQSAHAERLVTQTQECLTVYAARTGGGYPAGLDDLPVDEEPCAGAALLRSQTREQTVLRYQTSPPDVSGVRRTFTLCAQPSRVPDRGMVTVVGDDTGVVRRVSANDAARGPVACSAAWGAGSTGAVKRLQSCLTEYVATQANGFPATLNALDNALPQCMAGAVATSNNEPHVRVLRINLDSTIGVHYVPADPDNSGVVSAYQLYVQCSGRVDKAVVNERSELIDGLSVATRWWLNDCQDPATTDTNLLAQRAGYRLNATAIAGAEAESTAPTPSLAVAQLDPLPDFGAIPDLPARRAECDSTPRRCYGLALELERAVSLDGGNPNRDETLSPAHRALAQEANRAYQRACRDGEVRACYAEADVLLNARTIREDLPRALTLLEQSCRDGYALSCVRVGELRERGRQASKLVPSAMRVTPDGESQPFMMSVPDPSQPGIAADVGLSIAAYRAACALGESAECLRAARVALESQASAPPERQRAIEDLQKFCASGQAFACELLAQQAAASGGAIAGNTAAQWRRRACVLGERGSCDD